ncbi:MAG: DUF4340 domain-containing protein [Kiritimatiellia bacterium]|jgi:hypothetical protein|nr:DUF4340 domain-containing protein [Kiritimatiellia bacterium]MDP6631836.1 DUF4340 domain-containing protein [Kiritimatiellia bacterium]MDP6809171.1 DUF4340 domain-containing protein [Kiritimatiellia bacterium]
MKAKNLIVLLVIAVVLGGVAIWTQRSDEEPSDLIGELVVGELPLNDVAALVITTPDSTSRLARSADVWVSESDFNYPADFNRIKAAVLKVSELKVGQVVEAEAADKAAMKMVSPIDSPDGGTQVDLLDASGKQLASLLVGETRKRSGDAQSRFGAYPDGQFVSPDSGETVYLVTDTLYEFNQASGWLDKELVSVQGTDVTSVSIAGPDRDTLELAPSEGGSDLVVPELGKQEEMNATQANSIKSALSYLRFESVADPTLADDTLALDTPDTFVVRTKRGEIYTVQIGAKTPDSDNRYARVSVALEPAAPEASPADDAEQTGEEKQAAEAEKTRKSEARAALEQTVADLNATLGPWTYVIASYKTDAMRSTRDQVVQAIEDKSDDKKEEE